MREIKSTEVPDTKGRIINEGDMVELQYMRKGGGAMPDKLVARCEYRDGGFWIGEFPFVDFFRNNAEVQSGHKYPMYMTVIDLLADGMTIDEAINNITE